MNTHAAAVPRPGVDARASHEARLETSRRAILDAVRFPSPFTLVRGIGNLGDQLIAAGARSLLAGLAYREVSLDEAVRGRGALAVLMGSGAWCAPFHEVMPAALRQLTARYERVVVLPSSFDVSLPDVRRALATSGAVVFAREEQSLRQIAPLCDARLAHDTAFFFDFTPYVAAGGGVLHAFRGDAEASGHAPQPSDNRDISTDLGTLDEWLWTIARHDEVHTDRAHVMIAAAMLGKPVVFHPSVTHKLPGIAAYALAGFPVVPASSVGGQAPSPVWLARATEARTGEGACPPTAVDELRARMQAMGEESLRRIPATLSAGEPRVTVVVLSWNRIEPLARCLDSLARNVRMPFRRLVVDNGSEPDVRVQVAALVATQANAELQQLDTNVGCSAARQLAAERCTTEYMAFVDDDAEVFAGTIENLVATLQEHPAARVAGARVVLPDGRVQHCGGDFTVRDGIIRFLPLERGRAVDDPAITSRPCRWIGGTAFACRSALFADYPLDRGMTTYFEDNEWCYRIAQTEPDAFRTAAGALVLHHQQSKERQGSHRDELLRATRFLAPLARFYERHGLVQDDLFGLVPELALPDEGRDVAAARLLLELVLAKGSDWVALQWLSGGLEPLFLRQPLAALTSSRWYRLASLYWRVRKGRR